MAMIFGPLKAEQCLALEWVLPGRTGSYSSSTVAFANTRKQHGLLVSSSGAARHLLVSKFEEKMENGKAEWSLSTNQYQGAIHPDGYAHLKAFSSSPLPTFEYEAGGARVEKTIFPIEGAEAFGVRYAIFSKVPLKFSARPFLNFRASDSVANWKGGYELACGEKFVSAKRQGMSASVFSGECAFARKEEWYYNMLYARDAERQTECVEMHFSPGEFSFQCKGNCEIFIVACEGEVPKIDAGAEFERALAKAKSVVGPAGQEKPKDEFLCALLQAADAFVVSRQGKPSIIAGYPWFGEWGRDSFISLEGLLLCTGRHAEAKGVLLRFASRIEAGLVPNLISLDGKAAYNAADASLWFLRACSQYAAAAKDAVFVSEIYLPSAKKIVEGYVNGTQNGICVDKDGLVRAGAAGPNRRQPHSTLGKAN
ncbi:MAG: glycogen debranching enzyme N-terminal domain-containing protein [Candidatus Micrarchaeota archaeon]|nr:glycogen debranching enzyme N-terminal domain-containing protein [Candidatus Micrarchaeota archaeon]